MKQPFFSIIIPTLNEEKYLPNLLLALAKQHSPNFEVIVVDGHSQDKTIAVAKRFGTGFKHFQLLESPQTSLPYQRNFGAKHARGEWFIFIDADSVVMPYFIERISVFISNKSPQFFTTWSSSDSDVTSDALLTLLNNMLIEGSTMVRRPFSPGPLTIVKKSVFEYIGGYDEARSFGEDQDFSQRLWEKGIKLEILRETMYVLSLRRFRKQGTLKVLRIYMRGLLTVLFTKRVPRSIPGYLMGGHLYSAKRKKDETSLLRQLERRLKLLITELFD